MWQRLFILGIGRDAPVMLYILGSWQKGSPMSCLGYIPILHLVAVFLSHIPLGSLMFPAENVPIPFPLAALVSIMLK